MDHFSCMEIDQILDLLESSKTGLSGSEAQHRQDLYGKNKLHSPPPVPAWKILISQFANFIIYLLLVAVFFSVVIGEYSDSIVILIILIMNGFIGFFQELKANRSLEALKKMSSLDAKVVRDNLLINTAAEDLVPDIKNHWLLDLLAWADEYRTLGVWANADYPDDAKRARLYGAEGIGLCRSEHMFFETERLPLFQKMIMADLAVDQRDALYELLQYQREDFAGLFRVMDGLPVTIRLIDPPLHEFLPDLLELTDELSDLKLKLKESSTLSQIDELLKKINAKEKIRVRVLKLKEQNPMLGMRGVRLGIHIQELTKMQVRAIFEAACQVSKEDVTVLPKVMIPLVCHANELKIQRASLEQEARRVMDEQQVEINYEFGTMIELPRAALTAEQIAQYAEFFSYGTNDLTQTTYGISRDDAESGFLVDYVRKNILPDNPFATLDKDGVAQLMGIGITKGRKVRPDLECGICGEHGGDPKSIEICHKLGLDYVSCSPFRVPIARLAAAHAALK